MNTVLFLKNLFFRHKSNKTSTEKLPTRHTMSFLWPTQYRMNTHKTWRKTDKNSTESFKRHTPAHRHNSFLTTSPHWQVLVIVWWGVLWLLLQLSAMKSITCASWPTFVEKRGQAPVSFSAADTCDASSHSPLPHTHKANVPFTTWKGTVLAQVQKDKVSARNRWLDRKDGDRKRKPEWLKTGLTEEKKRWRMK